MNRTKYFCACLMLFFSTNIWAQVSPLYIGSYTGNGSDGVYVYDFDQNTGTFTLNKSIKTSNPSFLARQDNMLYFVNENNKGEISAYDLKDNKLVNALPTNGAHPCHVSLSVNAPLAVVSNYSGGSLVLYSLNPDGSLGKQEDFLQFNFVGTPKSRQEKSHIHAAFFTKDSRYIYVSDLGADIIYKMAIDKGPSGYKFRIVDEIKTKAGGGPRHIVIGADGNTLYAVLELTGELEVLAKENNKWVSKQLVPIHSEGFVGEHGAADIKASADGKYIYATNRGASNEVVVYKVAKNGSLSLVQVLPVGGISPRNLQLSPNGKWMFFANQASNNVTIFKRDTKTGKLENTNTNISIPSAVCTIF